MTPGLDDKIHSFLKRELGKKYRTIAAATPLVSTGLIDSVALVRLAALLETESGLVIPDRDITAEHFDTIEKMHAYLDARQRR